MKTSLTFGTLMLAALLSTSLPSNAQQQQQGGSMAGHGSMAAPGMGQGSMPGGSASSTAYMQSMEKMNRDMGKPMSGDPDHDFAMMMIPHHQGAIDMAKIELQYGKDKELRKVAEKVIKDQEKEIRQLNDWMKRHK